MSRSKERLPRKTKGILKYIYFTGFTSIAEHVFALCFLMMHQRDSYIERYTRLISSEDQDTGTYDRQIKSRAISILMAAQRKRTRARINNKMATSRVKCIERYTHHFKEVAAAVPVLT
jgi:hypothetical protein